MKQIKCPKLLKGCNTLCMEVKQLGYPKQIHEGKKYKREYYEHRFVCPRCGKEWLVETRPDLRNQTSRIPSFSQYKCKFKHGKVICTPNPKNSNYKLTLKYEKDRNKESSIEK